MVEVLRTIKLELLPLPEHASPTLIIRTEDGSQVEFSDSEEANEFMTLWFGMTQREIAEYWGED